MNDLLSTSVIATTKVGIALAGAALALFEIGLARAGRATERASLKRRLQASASARTRSPFSTRLVARRRTGRTSGANSKPASTSARSVQS